MIMLGFLIFYDIWRNLGEDCRNKILGNIFDFSNVSVASVNIGGHSITLRMYKGNVYYQYLFILNSGENLVRNCHRIVSKVVFLKNESNVVEGCDFILRLSRCRDEREVYLLLREVL